MDPFLRLVSDAKLQAVADTARKPSLAYGSKEDDEDALKSLSAIKLTESQSKESFSTMIVQSLGISFNVMTKYHVMQHQLIITSELSLSPFSVGIIHPKRTAARRFFTWWCLSFGMPVIWWHIRECVSVWWTKGW